MSVPASYNSTSAKIPLLDSERPMLEKLLRDDIELYVLNDIELYVLLTH
jgi:hypothetical protein